MRKTMASIPLALAAALCGGASLAQEVASFTELSACRIDAERILIKATFDGSACWAVEAAGLAEPRGTIVAVHFPTTSTAEICTMQIVPVTTEQVIEAPEPVIDLDVAALDPENNRVAHGVIEASEGQGDCLAARG
jgi:hypothetical protein